MHNPAIKTYVPIFKRMVETKEIWSYPFSSNRAYVKVPKYERYDPWAFYGLWRHTTKPKLTYTIQRIRSRRVGQMELFPVLGTRQG